MSSHSSPAPWNPRPCALLAALYLPLVLAVASPATAAALMLDGWRAALGAISIGTLVTFLEYTRHCFDPTEPLDHGFATMSMAQAAAARVLRLVDAQPETEDGRAVRERLARRARVPKTSGPDPDG